MVVNALHDAHRRPVPGMCRRLAILLVLQLISGSSQECISAEQTGPAARAEVDSVAVVRKEQEHALERSDRKFLPFVGKRVGRIRIMTLAVFGPSVDDTTRVSPSRLARILNNLNFPSRATTIRRNLLFKEGDLINALRMADSERIVRNLAFIRDARIVVRQNSAAGDSADVLVIVKEAWNLRLSVSPKTGNGLKVGLTEGNLLGLGQEVSGALTIVPTVSPRLEGKYSVQNIRGSFVTGQVEYVSMPAEKMTALGLSREPVSSVLGYAGGLDLRRTSIAVADSTPSGADNASDLIDVWAGRQFHLGLRQKGIDRRRILSTSARIRSLSFYKRPPVTPSTFSQFHNINYILGSLALIQSSYYRTSLLYNFGRTEDVPYGFLARVTYGLADEEFARKPYASATLAAGQKIDRLGYGAGELRIGGNPRAGKLEQGVIRLRTLYFSTLLRAGGYRFRQFVNAGYTTGIRRPAGDSIGFSGDQSIRGVVYSGSVTGSKSLELNLDTVAFTPWIVRGVTFAFFTFVDLDIIGSGHRDILAQDYYSGLGLGVRLHREAWGIAPIQLRFAWYPRLPVDHNSYSYTAFGEERLRSIEFLGSRPEIVEY
jgi:hypothetical protein